MSKPSPKTLLKLSNLKPVATADDGKLATPANLDLLIARVNEQYVAIKQGDRATALRAIFAGLLLYQIKNEAGHGNFMRLAAERMPAIPPRTRQDYMKLAMACVEKSKMALPERINIPDAQIALQLQDGEGVQEELVTKAVGFIGDLSLHELMIKYDIRAVGLKKDLTDGEDEGDDFDKLPPDEQIRIRRERIFGETAEHLNELHTCLTNAENLQLLESTQLDAIEGKLIELKQAIDTRRKTA